MRLSRFSHYLLIVALLTATATVEAAKNVPVGSEQTVDFGRHIVPMLYKLGCSSGTCHGSFSGKGGFRLSLFAARADIDHANIRGGYGRRIDPFHVNESLLLRKPSQNGLGHGGGVRFAVNSSEYNLLKQWIVEGARYDSASSVKILGVRVEPPTVTAKMTETQHKVRVIAKLSDGSEDDVTRFTTFESRDPSIAEIDADGNVKANHIGDIPVLAHYAGHVAFTIIEVPGKVQASIKFPDEKLTDPVDRFLVDKMKRLNIVPSASCTDTEFIRRAYLDTTSTLPTADEVRVFLANKSPAKRTKLIDSLLDHPLHHALWATKLTDMLGADNRFLDPVPYHDWFRNKFEQNMPWDKIAYGVFCGTAADERSPEKIQADLKKLREERDRKKKAAKNKKKDETKKVDPNAPKPWQTGYGTRKTMDAIYSGNKFLQQIRDKNNKTLKTILDSKKVSLQLANAFLGLQLTCAQCHKHPYDKWTQRDFFGFASVFTYVRRGVDPELKKMKINLNGIYISTEPEETFDDPATNQPLGPRNLGGDAIEVKAGSDPRRAVWEWMVEPSNPYFARAIINRVWAHYLGRGLFEPVDSQSAANPPSHPEVLDELVRDFVEHGYDLKRLHRRILNLVAYQRSWQMNIANAEDDKNYSHRLLKRMTAEQVVDSLCIITGTKPDLKKVYYTGELREGSRMIEMALSRYRGDDWHSLLIFGKPRRVQACDCERGTDPSLSQAMYLYNDESVMKKIAAKNGRLKKLVDSTTDDEQLLEELYLWTLSRLPTESELEISKKYMKTAESRLIGYQDILWSLFNQQEFIVNH